MRLLDLFCGAGGAAVGYNRAGFDEIVGVDIAPQPRYPFEFVQADALDYMGLVGTFLEGHYDAIHASPPCQHYSIMRNLPWLKGRDYPALIGPVREHLVKIGLPWVIENVAGAATHTCEECTEPMGSRYPAITICGLSVGLPTYRHRLFESNVLMMAPSHPPHPEVLWSGMHLNARYSGSEGMTGGIVSLVGHTKGGAVKSAREAVGLEWMKRDEATQAIPPAYTQYIGEQLIAAMREEHR